MLREDPKDSSVMSPKLRSLSRAFCITPKRSFSMLLWYVLRNCKATAQHYLMEEMVDISYIYCVANLLDRHRPHHGLVRPCRYVLWRNKNTDQALNFVLSGIHWAQQCARHRKCPQRRRLRRGNWPLDHDVVRNDPCDESLFNPYVLANVISS